ncbi:MAG: gliding motility-associated C-terminal domain-containing protein [Saprospiraceae bacterium]
MIKNLIFPLICALASGTIHDLAGQNCVSAGRDSLFCGLSYTLKGSPEGGQWSYICDVNDIRIISLDSISPGQASAKVAGCGIYNFVYTVNTDSCVGSDTVTLEFENTSFRLQDISYSIGLDYQVVACQPSPADSCGATRILPGIIPPLPNWKFKMKGDCEVYSAEPTIYGAKSNCIADSITHSVHIMSAVDSVEWNTSQNAFLRFDANRKLIQNRFNPFFNLISGSILDELELKCPLPKCFNIDRTACTDTSAVDTFFAVIPVHEGGNWYLKNDTGFIQLSTSNYVEKAGFKYFLYVPMGGDYYGPNDISFELYSTDNQLNPIPLRNKVDLDIVWREKWSYDTITFYQIRETNQDRCFCNGTTVNFSSFVLPGVPEFNCNLTRLVFIPEEKPLINGPDFLCVGGSVLLEADKDYFKYQWNNGDSTKSIRLTEPGKVVLTTINNNGCQGRDSVIVRLVDTPSVKVVADQKILCRGECVNLTAETESGNIVIWDVLDTVRSIRVCPSVDATYFVRIINANECISEASVSLKVYNSPQPVLGNDLILNCTIKQVKISPIDPDLGLARRFEWNGPGITSSNKDSLSPIVNVPGKYWFTVFDSISGCTGADTLYVSIDTMLPIASAGQDSVINCLHSKINLQGSGSDSGAGFSLTWQGPAINGQNLREINPQIDKAGQYVVTVRNLNNNCISRDTVIISSNFRRPDADAGPDRYLFCDSTVVTLDGTKSTFIATDIIVWSGPGVDTSKQRNSRIQVGIPGIYKLLIMDPESHCSDSSIVIVDAPDTIVMIKLIKRNDLGCIIDSSILSAAGTTGQKLRYAWSGPSGIIAQNIDSVIVHQAGKYYVYVYDSASHCSALDSVTVSDSGDRPFVNAGPDRTITCELTAVILSGSVNIPIVSATINWRGSGINGANSGNLTPTVSRPGEYILTITDKRNNCVGYDTVYVTENLVRPSVDLGADQTLNCIHDTLNILAKVVDTKPTYDFRWVGPGISSANQRNNPQTIRQPGVFIASVVTPNPVCSVSDTLMISIDTLAPKLSVKDTLWFDCQNKIITYTVTDFSKIDSVEWFDILNRKVASSEMGRSITFVLEGTHSYIAHYKNGCMYSAKVVVIPYTVISVAKPELTPSCANMANGSARIRILSGSGPFKLSLNGSREDTITYFNNLTPGSYKVRIFDRNGGNCFVDIFFDIPSLIALPDSLDNTRQEFTICSDTTIYADTTFLEATQYRFPKDSVTFQWFLNQNPVNPFSNKLLISQPGEYELRIVNKNGCGKASIFIAANLDDSLAMRNFKLANVFTPGEQTDNTFKPYNESGVNLGKGNYLLKIYNRWGAVVFETEDQNEAWDGYYKGQQAPADTYIVILTIKTCQAASFKTLKGSLNLIR